MDADQALIVLQFMPQKGAEFVHKAGGIGSGKCRKQL